MARNLELELEMHHDFDEWVADHNHRTGGKIKDSGYDPEKYPQQRIDVVTSPALIDIAQTEKQKVAACEELKLQYAVIMGSYAAARAQINAFKEAPAFEDSSELLVDTVANYIEDGKSIGLISDHAEGLFDMAVGQGGLSLALEAKFDTPLYINRFNSWVNKLMTRQTVEQQTYSAKNRKVINKNVYIPYLLSIGGGIRWVIPDTENGSHYISDPAISKAVNLGALKSFTQDKKSKKGTVEVLVPSGTQMRAKRDSNQKLEYLIAPSIPESSANLLSHLEAIITFSSWSGRVSVSKLIELNYQSRNERAERMPHLASEISRLMREQTQNLAGVPVYAAEEINA